MSAATAQKLGGIEDDLGLTGGGPGPFELHDDAAVGGAGEAVFGKRGPCGVADEAFERGPILGFDKNAGVEGKSLDEGGARLAGQSGPGAHGAGAEPGRGLFVLRPQKVVFVRVGCAIPVAAEERGDAGADLEGEVLEFVAGRRRQAGPAPGAGVVSDREMREHPSRTRAASASTSTRRRRREP